MLQVVKLFDFSKTRGLSCSIVTYGVIIKALLRSRNPSLESKAFEILTSIPAMGHELNVEIFNQVLIYYTIDCTTVLLSPLIVIMVLI